MNKVVDAAFIVYIQSLLFIKFLAPTGAQEMQMFVCLSVCSLKSVSQSS